MRIVSLLPSATEILCGIGLGNSLVGISHACDFPDAVCMLPKVTRTTIVTEANGMVIDEQVRTEVSAGRSLFSLDRQLLRQLNPDIVVTQEVCGVCAVDMPDVAACLGELENPPKIITLKPSSLEDLFSEIEMLGEEANARDMASEFVASLRHRLDVVRDKAKRLSQRPRVVLLEWLEPLFSAGHWNPELVEIAGAEEILGQIGGRSREIRRDELLEADPDALIIACCGMPVAQAHQEWNRVGRESWWGELRSVRQGKVFVLDGAAYFNRPGPRLVDSAELLARTLHPDH